jgi:hypothetical protein
MRFKNIIRSYTTKISELLLRPVFDNSYPYEFMQKMTDNEVDIYLNEVSNQLKVEGIPTKNINHYNRIFRYLIEQRERLYQSFKIIDNDVD